MITNFQACVKSKNLKFESSSTLTKNEMTEIENLFDLQNRNKLDLQNLRDFVVMFYDMLKSDAQKTGDRANEDKFNSMSSAIVTAIDAKIDFVTDSIRGRIYW